MSLPNLFFVNIKTRWKYYFAFLFSGCFLFLLTFCFSQRGPSFAEHSLPSKHFNLKVAQYSISHLLLVRGPMEQLVGYKPHSLGLWSQFMNIGIQKQDRINIWFKNAWFVLGFETSTVWSEYTFVLKMHLDLETEQHCLSVGAQRTAARLLEQVMCTVRRLGIEKVDILQGGDHDKKLLQRETSCIISTYTSSPHSFNNYHPLWSTCTHGMKSKLPIKSISIYTINLYYLAVSLTCGCHLIT